MSTQTRPPQRGARPQTGGPGVRWLVLALVLEALLALVDAFSVDVVVFTTAFVLAPVALAIGGRWRHVAIAAAVAFVLAIASGWWNHYAGTTDHILRVTIVAAGGALAVLAAHALGGARADRARMAVLAAVGRLSGAEREEDAVEGLASALVPAVADLCWVYLRTPGGEPRRLLTAAGDADIEDWLARRELPARSPTRMAFFDGQSRLLPMIDAASLDAASSHAVERERFVELGLRSSAIVPLRAADRVIGVLGLAVGEGRGYDARDLEFFEIIAGRVALVLANARLVTDLRSTRARLDGILGALAEAVTVNDESGQTIYANDAAARLLGRDSPSEVIGARPGELASRFAITKEDGSPVGIEDFPGRRLLDGHAGPSLLTRSVDRVSGQAYWLLTKATLLHDDEHTLAVNIIEDVTDAKSAELRQRFLAEAGRVLASSLDYEQTLQRVARLAVPSLADWCTVDLPAPGGAIQQVALAHADPSKIEQARELRRRYPPDPAAATGVSAVLAGGPAELYPVIPERLLEGIADTEELAAVRALGLRAVMIVPMRAGEETLGAITLVSSESGRTFDEDDFQFAQDLALRAGTAVQNARLYADQVRVAHTLQASLLPERLPQPPGWEAAAGYQAGEQGAEVGGDFYDIVAVERGQLVFLGDVTGKGIAAAALTALVRHSVRTAARFDPRPAAVLALVNQILLEQPRLSPVTLVCGLVERDGDGARITLAAGGHPRPLHRRGGRVGEIGPRGMLLGALAEIEVAEETTAIEPGDTILLYTDGVTDTPGAGERFGPQRLAAVFAEAPEAPAAVVEAVEEALREFQVGTAVDDRALLALRFTGESDGAGE
jgi:PAS domain S-box-containing protein